MRRREDGYFSARLNVHYYSGVQTDQNDALSEAASCHTQVDEQDVFRRILSNISYLLDPPTACVSSRVASCKNSPLIAPGESIHPASPHGKLHLTKRATALLQSE